MSSSAFDEIIARQLAVPAWQVRSAGPVFAAAAKELVTQRFAGDPTLPGKCAYIIQAARHRLGLRRTAPRASDHLQDKEDVKALLALLDKLATYMLTVHGSLDPPRLS